MNVTLSEAVLTVLHCVGYCAVAAALIRRHAVSQWPALFALCVFQAVLLSTNLALASGGDQTYAAYYWTYWCGSSVATLLTISALLNAAWNIPLASAIPKALRQFFLTATLLTATLFAVIAASQAASTSAGFSVAALALNHANQVVVGAVALCLIGAVAACGLAWDNTAILVASGIMLREAVTIPGSYLLALHPHQSRLIHTWQDALALTALPLWLWSLTRPVAAPDTAAEEEALAFLHSIPGLYVPHPTPNDVPQ